MLQSLLPHRFTADDELRQLGEASTNSLGPSIDVLVWNIFKARRANWAADFKALAFDKDLVLLQEAVLNAPSDVLFEQNSGLQWIMARSFRHRKTAIEHGIKTGCTALACDRKFYLSEHSEPLSHTQKLLLSTQYPLAGTADRLLVINMHAINFVGDKKYVDQLSQLSVAMDGHTGPMILAGDFNTWSATRLQAFRSVADKAGLLEAQMTRQCRLAHLNQHLDHVFYRGLTLRSIDSLAHVRSSDHAPIVARFELAEQAH